jgi:uncharacterized membrane protein YbhN (UPF0104 family)
MKRPVSRLVSILRVVFGVGLLWYVLRATRGWQLVDLLLARPQLGALLTVWVLLGATVEAKRLALLLRSQGIDLPIWRGLRLVSIATFFGFFVPGGTGGDVAKLYSLAGDRPGQRVEVALVLLADRAMGLLSLVSLITVLAFGNRQLLREQALIRYLVGGAVLTAVAMLCAVALSWSSRLRASALPDVVRARLPGGRYAVRVWDALYAFRAHRIALAGALALSLLGHAVLCVFFVAVASRALPTAPAADVCLLGLLGMLANAAPLTPAGVGVGEAAFAGLFALAGYSGGSQLMLAWRLGALQLALAGGVLWLAGGRHFALRQSTPMGNGTRRHVASSRPPL